MKILKFTAPWCAPCKAMSVYWDEAVQTSTFDVEEFNVDDNPDKLQKYNIKSVPTMLIVDDEGVVLSNKTGSLSRQQLTDWFAEFKE